MDETKSITAPAVVDDKHPVSENTEAPEAASLTEFTNMGRSADVAHNFLASIDPNIASQPITKEESRKAPVED